jgi:hypothetical protein
MLRGNLSTRPFYNEGIVSLILAVVGVAGLALAAYNATELRALSARRGELRSAATANLTEAARIEGRAAAQRKNIDVAKLRYLSASTHEANELIDQRTFSWTGFFGLVERTLPLDAYLIGVTPKLEKGVFSVDMGVVSKTPDEVEDFVDALEKTGAFYNALPQQWRQNDDNTLTARIESGYRPAVLGAPPKLEAPKPGGKRP